jgi:hypothetical protein
MGRAWTADRPDDWHTDAYFTEVRQPSQTFDIRIDRRLHRRRPAAPD